MRVPLGLVADVIEFSWVDGPGNRSTVFMQGCNFDCAACHNPQTIALDSRHAKWHTVEDLLARIRPNAAFLTGVTVSGGEATIQKAFLLALFAAIRRDPATAHLTRFIDSNGSADSSAWIELEPETDGVMIDLKVFDTVRHRELTGAELEPVVDSIRLLHRIGLLYEVRLLPIPGVSDDDALLRATGAWLAGVDPTIRVVVNPFHRHGARARAQNWPEPADADRARYAAVLAECGLRDVRMVTPPSQ